MSYVFSHSTHLIHVSPPYILTPYIPNELRSASECAIKHIHTTYIYSHTLRTSIIPYVFSHSTHLNNIIHISSPHILTPYKPNELRGAGECAITHIHVPNTYILTLYTPNELCGAGECAITHIHVPNTYILTLYTPNELCGAGECAIKDIHLLSLGHGSQELYAHTCFFWFVPLHLPLCACVCFSVFQCIAVHCSALQCIAVCCSVLQCVVVSSHSLFRSLAPSLVRSLSLSRARCLFLYLSLSLLLSLSLFLSLSLSLFCACTLSISHSRSRSHTLVYTLILSLSLYIQEYESKTLILSLSLYTRDYGVATISGLLKITGLFCRISSL